jgi:hypothetical protein
LNFPFALDRDENWHKIFVCVENHQTAWSGTGLSDLSIFLWACHAQPQRRPPKKGTLGASFLAVLVFLAVASQQENYNRVIIIGWGNF